MNSILVIILGLCFFFFSVYFTRWVFGIDKIIQNQKEQNKLLKNISENLQRQKNVEIEKQNDYKKTTLNSIDKHVVDTKSTKIMDDENYCPACKNPIQKNEKECSNCGLILKE